MKIQKSLVKICYPGLKELRHKKPNLPFMNSLTEAKEFDKLKKMVWIGGNLPLIPALQYYTFC